MMLKPRRLSTVIPTERVRFRAPSQFVNVSITVDAIIQTVSEENGDGSQTIHAIRFAAEELFDAGYWQSIMERTNERYGLWGIAFLETLLRAADVTISMEGR